MLPKHFRRTIWMFNFDSMTNINYSVFIWNVFEDTLLLLIVYAWKMYGMQTLHAGAIPMFGVNIPRSFCINKI